MLYCCLRNETNNLLSFKWILLEIKMETETAVDVLGGIEQIVIDFGNICRFCLAETNNNVSIHDRCFVENEKERDEGTIIDFVTKITSIKMDNLDGFPSLVCESCFSFIKMYFEFRESCLQSDHSLRDCYQKTLEEAKAKFSSNIEIEERKYENVEITEKECANGNFSMQVEENSNVCNKKRLLNPEMSLDKENFLLKLQKKRGTFKKDSLSVIKAGTIKQKYQRISSLSERLKEAQSKLAEDILRTQDIITTSVIPEDQSNCKSGKMKLSCPQCLINFPNSEMLSYHFITSHIAERKNQRKINIFQCKICKKEFGFTYQIMRHYKTAHKIPTSKLSLDHLTPKNGKPFGKKFECLDCQPSKTFNKKSNFIRHLTHHGIVEDRLKRSLKQESTGRFFTCKRCDTDQTFATKFSLNRHLMNIHKLERSEISDDFGEIDKTEISGTKLMKVYVCIDCSPPISFSGVSLFIQHKSDIHERNLENMSLKELTPVYVESMNVFESSNQFFKVICKSCDTPSEFHSTSEFVRHMKLHHGEMVEEKWDVEAKFLSDSVPARNRQKDRMWKCTECSASYIRKHSLHYHLREKHNKNLRLGSVRCPESNCDETFFTNRQVIQHGITVHGKYFANLHKVFKEKILHDSTEIDKRVRNFECDICQRKYLGKTSLKRHIMKSHLGKSDSENAICSYCGKTFSNNLNLKSHIDFVHEALFVSCPICKKNINLKTIGKHYKIHQSNSDCQTETKNRFLCNQCGRVLKSKSGFDDHQKLHLNVRDQICDICGSGFTTKKNLYIHKKAHDLTQKKLFECDQCDKVFTGKHTLNRHLLTHSGEKNFICEICSKCFYTLQELNRHVRYHKKEYRFDCQLCEMRFLDRSRFRHHMMRHRNIRPHKCHFCDKVFIVRRKMNLHMAARHNVEIQNTKGIWKDPKTYIPLDDLL